MAELLELMISLLKLAVALFVILCGILLVLAAAGTAGYFIGFSKNRSRRTTYLVIARASCFALSSLVLLVPSSRILVFIAWPVFGCGLVVLAQIALAFGATRRDREDTAERLQGQLQHAFGAAIADIKVLYTRGTFSVTGRVISPGADPLNWQASIRCLLAGDGHVARISISAPVGSSPGTGYTPVTCEEG